jgi:hypothetical protein
MRIIAILVLVFGVALAGGALFFASEYFKGINALNAQQQGAETVRVLAARQSPRRATRSASSCARSNRASWFWKARSPSLASRRACR